MIEETSEAVSIPQIQGRGTRCMENMFVLIEQIFNKENFFHYDKC